MRKRKTAGENEKNQIHFAVTTSRRLSVNVSSTELFSSFSSSASIPAFFIKIFCFSFRKTASHNALRPLFAFTRVNLVYTDIPPHLCRMEKRNLLSNYGRKQPYSRTVRTVHPDSRRIPETPDPLPSGENQDY